MNRITGVALLSIAAAIFAPAYAQTTTTPETTESTAETKAETSKTEPVNNESASEASTNTSTEAAAEQAVEKKPAEKPAEKEVVEKKRELRVASWGGAYGQAQIKAIIRPAEKQLSVAIQRLELKDSEPSSQAADVLELRQGALLRGCKNGEYLRRAEIQLAPSEDGSSPEADYLAGGLTDCGVASFAWSSLVLFDRSKFKKAKPNKLADVFDIKRFKGKRAFLRKAENLIEMLALATLKDVAPETVYDELAKRESRDKAFAQLQALLPHIIWVDTPSQALAKLESGEARFAAGFSGRAFRKTIAGNYAAIWDGHVYDYLSWAISSKAGDKEVAKKFVEIATSPSRLADQAKQWPYGPMRKSAAASVGRHATLDIDLAPFMPTSTLRLPQGVRRDPAFWEEHGARLNDRLAALKEGFPLGVRTPPPTRRPPPPPTEQN
ncbi:MAG: extracellular solute-binding protein [Pseudomonadota bacterium]